MESDTEPLSLSNISHGPRALTLIAVSILTITVAGIGYLRPSSGSGAALQPAPAPAADKLRASYQLAAVDFVTPTSGWVIVESQGRDFVVLHTADAGDTWDRQLMGSAGIIGEYVRFFDPTHGVLVLLGAPAALYQTSDAGSTWRRQALAQDGAFILSADFVDANHGWLLAQASTEGEVLLRTEDGGGTWAGLGSPVAYADWAYRVTFANLRDGWLYSQSAAPYAYRSRDGGATWRRVPLPGPPGGWPASRGGLISTGEFFVAAHTTQGSGVVATVIAGPPQSGRSSRGGVLMTFPVVKVRTFDGGGAATSVYADVSPYRYPYIQHVNAGSLADTEPANQFQLSSLDGGLSWRAIAPPSTYGAVGYIDARNWWWIGPGVQSSTSDAGMTWTTIRGVGVPEPLPVSLQFVDANHAWFGAMAGTRPLLETTEDGGIHWRMILLPALTST